MKERVFIDTDVIIDIAIARKPFVESGASLLSKIEAGIFDGFTSSVIFTNVYYIHKKLSSHEIAVSFLKKLRLILKVLPVDDLIIQKGLESGMKDFEDSVQYFTSTKNRIDYIITRNVEDFKNSIIKVHTPEEFLILKGIKEK